MEVINLINNIKTDWKNILLKFSININNDIIVEEYFNYTIFPPQNLILSAFDYFNIIDTKVVIIGQDVYPNLGNAMGLCFSVHSNVKCPASLRNIFKELENEYGIKRTNPNLCDWAQQGVLMLNTALTVRDGEPGSHIKIWKEFTKDIIKYIVENTKNVCFLLWGEYAISYKKLITNDHYILTHSHPSPLSRKQFVGNNHFKLCNEYLKKYNKQHIKWI